MAKSKAAGTKKSAEILEEVAATEPEVKAEEVVEEVAAPEQTAAPEEAAVVEEVAVAEPVAETLPQAETSTEAKQGKGAKVVAGVKEWCRKKVVGLKRKPQNIGLFVMLITSLVWIFTLNITSPGPYNTFNAVSWLGLCLFVTTLFSILVLVLYLGIFPKYPKVNKKTGKKSRVNYTMLVLTFVFIAVMIAMDVLYYVILTKQIAGTETSFFGTIKQAERFQKFWGENFTDNYNAYKANEIALEDIIDEKKYAKNLIQSLNICIAHIVLLGVSALLLATLPLYKKLILKINTSKEIDSNEIKETIDVEDE